jgi:purine nucleosidase
MPDARTPLILDVDTGIDDALGLLYICAAPEARILGVSTVAGNIDLTRATRNTRAVLALADRPDIAVWPGCDRPLIRTTERASAVHGESGLGLDEIFSAARAHAWELILIATGPLTNVAVALMREPALPRLLKRLVLMGGAFREGGNVTPAAEFNIWHDPEAAHIVFNRFGGEGAAPLVAVGLDVTRQTLLLPGDVAELARRCEGARHAGPLLRFLEDATRHYFEFMEQREGRRHFVMHDPLAIAAAIDPTLIETTAVAVDVETSGALASGLTLADWRGVWRRKPNAQVATAVRAKRFIEEFIAAMERLARRQGTPQPNIA